jgi:hypothetical protein
VKVPLVIPRKKQASAVAAGSRYITNFDADSAWQAAHPNGQSSVSLALGRDHQGCGNSASQSELRNRRDHSLQSLLDPFNRLVLKIRIDRLRQRQGTPVSGQRFLFPVQPHQHLRKRFLDAGIIGR